MNIRERLGGSPDAVTEIFIKELTESIGDTGVKAGIIKVVTGYSVIGEDEHISAMFCENPRRFFAGE